MSEDKKSEKQQFEDLFTDEVKDITPEKIIEAFTERCVEAEASNVVATRDVLTLLQATSDPTLVPLFESAICHGMREGFMLAAEAFLGKNTAFLLATVASIRAADQVEDEVNRRSERFSKKNTDAPETPPFVNNRPGDAKDWKQDGYRFS